MKVRSHLALLATAVLLPMVLVSALALSMVLDAERDAQLRSLREAVRGTSVAVDRQWGVAEGSARALRTSVLLERGDLAGFYQQAKTAIAGQGHHIALIDENGQQLFNTVRTFGAPIATPVPSGRQRIDGVLEKGVGTISNLVMGRATNQFITTFDLPLTTSSGQRYVLSHWYYARHFSQAFPTKDIPPSWLMAIFDREGRTIVRNRGPQEFEGKLPNADLLAAIRSGDQPLIRNRSRDGLQLYTALQRSPISGWTVAVGVPEDEIEMAARRSVTIMAAGLLAAILFGLGCAVLIGRRLVRAIDGAAASAAQLGQHVVPVWSRSRVDEIDALHQVLHRAGRVLQQSDAELVSLMQAAKDARVLAESQNRAKDDFLAMLGHELRNPLSAITAGIALFDAAGATDEARLRARNAIRRQCGLLTNIVDELLDASRVMNGKVVLSKRRIDLSQAAQACLTSMEVRGVTQGYCLVTSLEPAFIDADPTRLDQIINNLLENAFKYTMPGGQVELRVGHADGSAVLSVSDSGIGIGAELLPTLFDIFVQAPAGLDRANGGLGIGLSLVRAMVLQHGGAVAVSSPGEGRGSTFTVRLPLSALQEPELAQIAPPNHIQTGTVLVVDDNQDAREMLSTMLSISGYTVLEAADGASALTMVQSAMPKVAIIDIGLPDMNGYDVAHRLRGNPATAAITLIALTGYGQASDRAQALAAGFDRHLTKPVDFDTLFDALGRMCADC